MFVFDTETRTDPSQRLLFGVYRFIKKGQCLEENIIVADDLSPAERLVVEAYVKTHSADLATERGKPLQLLSLEQFLERLYRAAFKGRSLIVGFNLPFDLSRIAHDAAPARGLFAGGFSLSLWTYIDQHRVEQPNPHRPRIRIKHIDSKRALKGFTSQLKPDRIDLIPEGSETGRPASGYIFRGHFLDLRTLAFALTDGGHSLESACRVFGVEHGKQAVSEHGKVTELYIDYCRRDVLATSELALKLLEEYDRHPIELQVTQAYSPASIGKAYLRAMGIQPILERQPDFSKSYIGYAQSAFFGGRTSAHIRKVPVPVVYTDFLSMYPTVNSLMGLWQYVTAKEIKVIEHCQEEIESFLRGLNPDDLFKPDTWRRLNGFVRIVPNGDIVPSRGKYSAESNDWQVAVNCLHASQPDSENDALWFTLPDIVESVISTGRIPRITDAFRIEPHGKLRGLKPVKLRGSIKVDPRSQDFFKVVIEERKRLASRTDLSESEKIRLDKALKVLANSTSYGIYAEMNRQESDERTRVRCYGIDEKPFECGVVHPEQPGVFCFPPLAALITGGARLMLALLEHSVTALGGTYAMEDTDSMAIVASEKGGLVRCAGGPYRIKGKGEAVLALSWRHVRSIADRFALLNPYDHSAIPGSILKIEDDNFDPATGLQREIKCLAISAKRYALFRVSEQGEPVLLRSRLNSKDNHWSEHGLGHLLNPTNPESSDREWIAQVWLQIVRESMGLPTQKLQFEDVPAVGRVTVSSPAVLDPLAKLNAGKPYPDQIKPFNFLLTCQVDRFGHPIGTDPEHFHLIAPHQPDPRQWLRSPWIDQYTGGLFRITTTGQQGRRGIARVKTYGDVIRDYKYHPESKCADASGSPCGKQTTGLLHRRHVGIDSIKCIGKESNRLEEVEEGQIQSAQDVYTEYPDARRDEWEMRIRPALNQISIAEIVRRTGLSRRTVIDARTGKRRPRRENQSRLFNVAMGLGIITDCRAPGESKPSTQRSGSL